MSRRRHNPYTNPQGTWIRGSFHGHCCEHSACASVPLAQSVRQYRDLGAGFVTLTDHDVITDLSQLRRQYPELVLLHGFEYSTRENVLFVGPEVEPLYRLSLEQALAAATELLTVVCHPQPYASGRPYWTLEMLAGLGRWPDGVEVYNGHYGIPSALAQGRWPLYSSFWDELLSAGHRLWGFANDDFHDPADFDNAFNMVLVEERTPAGVVRAAKQGRSYASTGLLLHHVDLSDDEILVETAQPCNGRFVGPGGTALSQGEGTRFNYRPADEAYVRFEAKGQAGRLFLQPMFLESP